jgi:FkbM family methyltransferase
MTDKTPGVVDFRSDPVAVWNLYEGYEGELAFDIGANGGIVANMLAPNFTRVVAFEPAGESFAHLVESAAENVTPDSRAVSEHAGDTRFDLRSIAIGLGELVTGNSLDQSWGEAVGTRVVTATTLDDLMDEYGVPDFIKVDTEGHELAVIQGGKALFAEHKPLLILEIHSEQNGVEIGSLLPGYEWARCDHPSYTPGSYYQQNHYWLISQ